MDIILAQQSGNSEETSQKPRSSKRVSTFGFGGSSSSLKNKNKSQEEKSKDLEMARKMIQDGQINGKMYSMNRDDNMSQSSNDSFDTLSTNGGTMPNVKLPTGQTRPSQAQGEYPHINSHKLTTPLPPLKTLTLHTFLT